VYQVDVLLSRIISDAAGGTPPAAGSPALAKLRERSLPKRCANFAIPPVQGKKYNLAACCLSDCLALFGGADIVTHGARFNAGLP